MTNFDIAFNYLILEDEGSKYTNDPSDSGGPTKWGVTKKAYEEFFVRDAVPDEEIEQMTAATAKQIYRVKYWGPLRCEKILDLAFSVAIFDCGVLYGVGTIALLVQRSLASSGVKLKLDGILGDESVAALNQLLGGDSPGARSSHMTSLRDLLLERIDTVIAANPKDERFRHGWTQRADRLLQLLNDEFLNKFKEELFS